ncbi:transposase [Streptomyces sp. NPDC086796]|uniref:transposase n=1 Tax=unclassified Streptomyces TaxID=2593676 RepID=UPI00343A73E2
MREYVIEHLHDGAAVLVVNEASGVKKGNHAVGVQCRTPARPRGSSSQVVVQLVYASARDRSAVDRELYIPHSWMCDPDAGEQRGPVETPSSQHQAEAGRKGERLHSRAVADLAVGR